MQEPGMSKVDQGGVETSRIGGDFELKVGTVILQLAEIVDRRTEQGNTDSFSVDLTVHLPGGDSFTAIAYYDSESQPRGGYSFEIKGTDESGQEVKREIIVQDGYTPRLGVKGTVSECYS